MKKTSHFFRHGVFYTIAVGIEAAAPFLLAPLLTHYLSVYDYGLWVLFQSACAFLRPILGLTLDDYVRMHYYEQSHRKAAEYLLSILMLSVLLACSLFLLTLAFGDTFSHMLQFPKDWLWTIIACSWLHALFYLLLAYYQFGGMHRGFALIHCVQASLTLVFSVLLVIGGAGWTGAVFGKILGLFCGVTAALIGIAPQLAGTAWKRVRPAFMLKLAAFGIRYLPTGMLVVIVIFTNRLMLAHMEGIEAASLFAVASLFPMVLLIGIQGFVLGWQPWCFQRLSRRQLDDRRELALGAAVFFLGLPIGAVVLAWLSCLLGPYVIAPQFHGAFNYVPPLMIAMVAQGFHLFTRSILHFYQRLEILSMTALFIMLMNVLLNYIFIDKMGAMGAAWATAGAYGAGFLFAAFFAWRTLRMRYLLPLATER